jgi:hypothetical protein
LRLNSAVSGSTDSGAKSFGSSDGVFTGALFVTQRHLQTPFGPRFWAGSRTFWFR